MCSRLGYTNKHMRKTCTCTFSEYTSILKVVLKASLPKLTDSGPNLSELGGLLLVRSLLVRPIIDKIVLWDRHSPLGWAVEAPSTNFRFNYNVCVWIQRCSTVANNACAAVPMTIGGPEIANLEPGLCSAVTWGN